ncbi:MAG: HNH endonuclease [Alistipes sp.]|nr:HNH endonuclease [Alistipes sp.]
MPRSWKENWPLHSSYTADDREDAVYCLGNLAILPSKLNTSISNASWSDKKDGKGKNLGMSHYAADIESLAMVITQPIWNEDTISNRADWIAEKVNEIWPSFLPEEEDEGASETLSAEKIRLSLNGVPMISMSRFVLDVVNAYMTKYPEVTFARLKEVFHDGLCSYGYRFKGLLCSEDVYNEWDNKNKAKRYMPDAPNRKLTSADGVVFYVNTQWTKDGIKGIVKLAKAEGFKVSIS